VRIIEYAGEALLRMLASQGGLMPVLITADVPGQTQEKYDQMLSLLLPVLQQAKGFIAHGAGASPQGWRTFEIWESSEDATKFFAQYIHPNLPPGVKPQRSLLELHSLVRP
jgi:hypothetical protein